MGAFNFEKLAERASSQSRDAEKIKGFADSLWTTFKVEESGEDLSADLERPFVTPIAWALFAAYRVALAYPVLQLAIVRGGLEPDGLVNEKSMIDTVRAALPEQAETLERFGLKSLPVLLPILEQRLLDELRSSLESGHDDAKAVEQASLILSAVETAVRDRQKAELSEVAKGGSVD